MVVDTAVQRAAAQTTASAGKDIMTGGALLLVIGAALITYGMRAAFLLSKRKLHFPPLVRMGLRHIPTAAFAALLLPAVVLMDGDVVLSLHNHQLLAAIVAAAAGVFVRSLFAVVLTGLGTLWLLNTLLL